MSQVEFLFCNFINIVLEVGGVCCLKSCVVVSSWLMNYLMNIVLFVNINTSLKNVRFRTRNWMFGAGS